MIAMSEQDQQVFCSPDEPTFSISTELYSPKIKGPTWRAFKDMDFCY